MTKRSCGHQDQTTAQTEAGRKWLRATQCDACWARKAQTWAAEMGEAQGMPGCTGSADRERRVAMETRMKAFRAYQQQVRPRLADATTEQQEQTLHALKALLAQGDPAWWGRRTQTDIYHLLAEQIS